MKGYLELVDTEIVGVESHMSYEMKLWALLIPQKPVG